jgi:hypothetical protein
LPGKKSAGIFESPPLELFHRTGTLAEDVRDLFHAELGDDAQQDDGALIGR